jgi:hypothetical protein
MTRQRSSVSVEKRAVGASSTTKSPETTTSPKTTSSSTASACSILKRAGGGSNSKSQPYLNIVLLLDTNSFLQRRLR